MNGPFGEYLKSFWWLHVLLALCVGILVYLVLR